ncbi:hypothetical protein GHI93_03795 [Lactococcus hircilactis]|uniref:Gram-positive pilin subunit D1 N-terminal domain-containing protein n=1 Tax=Lactococcus hircilactis TaxID=1494462 RepID=A0A7X1Z9N3_9LACT|nr:pilin N-terminal domain-containing protein [Lactococcus hircilactis]MQW39075.1 hypothetical protein [Lactococcus hircilactis]
MIRKKNVIQLFVLSAVFLLSLVFGSLSYADTAVPSGSGSDDYSITIIKYKLSESDLSSTTLPQQPVGSALTQEQAKDKNGNLLVPLGGVSYRIEQVTPSNDASNPFQVVPGSTSQTITTDSNGQATVKLPQGIYRVTELSSQTLLHPAAPVIVQLPMGLSNGQSLNQVFIYPKSGVVSPSVTTPPPSKDKEITRIPHTAGTLPSESPLFGLLVGVIIVGMIGTIGIKPKLLK